MSEEKLKLEVLVKDEKLDTKKMAAQITDLAIKKYEETIKPDMLESLYFAGLEESKAFPYEAVPKEGLSCIKSKDGSVRASLSYALAKKVPTGSDLDELIVKGEILQPEDSQRIISHKDSVVSLAMYSQGKKTKLLLDRDADEFLREYIAGRVQGYMEKIKKDETLSASAELGLSALAEKVDVMQSKRFSGYITKTLDEAKAGDARSVHALEFLSDYLSK